MKPETLEALKASIEHRLAVFRRRTGLILQLEDQQ